MEAAFGFLPRPAVAFLEPAEEFFPLGIENIPFIAGYTAPKSEAACLELGPITLNDILVHIRISFIVHDGSSAVQMDRTLTAWQRFCSGLRCGIHFFEFWRVFVET
jgi:hypothetical protein